MMAPTSEWLRATAVRPVTAWLGRTIGPPRGTACSPATKRCDFWNWGANYVRPECCTAHLTELAVFTHDLLERHGIHHWLDAGALLGAVRDGRMIPWDTDVDFGAVLADRPRIAALADEVRRCGHVLDASDPAIIRIVLSPINLQHADIFFWEERDGQLRLPADYPSHGYWPGMHEQMPFPASYVDPPGTIRLEGHSFPAPAPPERYLVDHLYGPGYLVPIRPPATHDLRPVVDREDLTPVVRALLAETAELERRLFFLKSRRRLSQLVAWQRWTDSALPGAADPQMVEDLRASRAEGGHGPVVDTLLHSVAILTQGIEELEHPTAAVYLRRGVRRTTRLVGKVRRYLP